MARNRAAGAPISWLAGTGSPRRLVAGVVHERKPSRLGFRRERASQLALCLAATTRRISAAPPASCAVPKAGASSRTAYAGARRGALGGVPREAFRLRQLEKFPFSGTIFW